MKQYEEQKEMEEECEEPEQLFTRFFYKEPLTWVEAEVPYFLKSLSTVP